MMAGLSLFDPLLSLGPLWLVGLVLIAASLLAREAGWQLQNYLSKRKKEEAEPEVSSDTIGATFGLLAFILAFTFSIALDRYDTRRTFVAEEANAIASAYRYASLFDEAERSRLHDTLLRYARTRVTQTGVGDEEMEARILKSAALRDKFWSEAREAILPVRDTERGAYFAEAVNGMIELGNRREIAGRAHVPSRILDVMLVYLLASAAMLGHLSSKKGGRRQASTVLLILFVVVIVLILDIDQPRAGTVTVPQRAMQDMIASLEAAAAAPAQSTELAPR